MVAVGNRIFVAAFLGGAAVGAVLSASVSRELSEPDPFAHAYDRVYWDSRLRDAGAIEAYAEFKHAYATSTDTHTAAHFIGDRIYAVYGTDGIHACDSSFGYGCFHQVAMRIVEDIGPDLDRLESICMSAGESSAVCMHGLGHGLAEINRTELRRALSVCGGFTATQGEACARGVYMEYLVPLMVRTGASEKQPLAESGTYDSPCTRDIPFRTACYFSLPQWWFAGGASVADVVARCDGVPHESAAYCFAGIGISMPGILEYDRIAIERACDSIMSETGRAACREESERTLMSLGKQ